MKSIAFLIAVSSLVSFSAIAKTPISELYANKEFVATCPIQFLKYVDLSEGGAGGYCECPLANIGYLDKADSGPGFFCSATPIEKPRN